MDVARGGGSRAQAVQIGAVILFSFLVIGFSMYQATVVPDQTEAVEASHSQAVQADMVELRNSVLRSAGGGGAQPTTVDLGPEYPPRAVFVNPAPASGRLRSAPQGSPSGIRVRNATAEDGEVADYWNGSRLSFETTAVVYEPEYNRYRNAPTTVYENSVLYNAFPGGAAWPGEPSTGGGAPVTLKTGQSIVSGTTVSLVSLQGSVAESGTGSVSVEPGGASPSSRTVAVRATDPTSNITVSFPTDLSEDGWARLLADQPHADVTVSGGTATLTLAATDANGDLLTYDLRIGAVGLGGAAVDRDATYVARVGGDGGSVREDGRRELVVEVRDRYNDPVSGVRVEVGIGGNDTTYGAIDGPRTVQTDVDGRARFVYDPNDVSGTSVETLDVGFGPAAAEYATFEFDVIDTDTRTGPANTRYDVVWDTARIDDQSRVEYHAGNDTLVIRDGTPIEMTAQALNGSDRIEGVNLDYATNDSGVAAFTGSNDVGATGADGRSTVDLDVSTGVATAFVSANEDGDRVRVRVVPETGGAYYRYYEDDSFSDEPSPSSLGLDSMPPADTGMVDRFDISPRLRDTHFAFNFTAYIDVPKTGRYTFYTTSDDGSWLYVDGTLVVDNGGDHATETQSDSVRLSAGRHDITVVFYENEGVEDLEVEWDGPGFSRETVPRSVLTPRIVSGDGRGPATNSLAVRPDPVQQGDPVDITATADDGGRGGSTVAAAEWFRGSDPGEGNANALTAADGSFDETSEAVEATGVDTSGWPTGDVTVSVRARDNAGNWGPTRTTTVTVQSSYTASWADPVASGSGAVDCTVPCGAPVTLTATSSGGGADGETPNYSSSDTGVASLSGATAFGGGEGTVELTVGESVGEATLTVRGDGSGDTVPVEVALNSAFETSRADWEHFGAGSSSLVDGTGNRGGSLRLSNADDGGVRTGVYDTRASDVLVVDYWAQEGGGSGGEPELGESPPEDLVLEYRTAGGSWVEVDRVSPVGGEDRAYDRRVTVDAAAARHDGFMLRFRQPGATATDPWYLGDVKFTSVGGTVNSPPSVEVTDIAVNERGNSGNVWSVDVAFVPDDPDGDLDRADVTVRIDGSVAGTRSGIDTGGREGQTVSVNVGADGSRGTVEATVRVYDTTNASGSDTENENQA